MINDCSEMMLYFQSFWGVGIADTCIQWHIVSNIFLICRIATVFFNYVMYFCVLTVFKILLERL